MGRPEKEVDIETLFDLLESGSKKSEIADEMGISQPTLSKRIASIQQKQGLILQYRALQAIQLTDLQAQILEKITPDKIDQAPLRDLVFAYKVLKDKELVSLGKPSDIKGMMHYLIELERQEQAGKESVKVSEEDTVDLEENEEGNWEDLRETMPKL